MTMLTLLSLQIFAKGIAQSITVREYNTSIEKIFNLLESKYGYHFVYTSSIVKNEKLITLNVTHASITAVLDEILKTQPLTYSIVDKVVIIKSIPVADVLQAPPVKGSVTDVEGNPLSNVTIVVKGTTLGVKTDDNGKFSLPDLPDSSVLLVSSVGYETQEIVVKGSSPVFIRLKKEDAQVLNEVVVVNTGYQTVNKMNSTGSVAGLNNTYIQKRTNATLSGLLAGTVPGLSVYKNQYKIRGGGSINSGTEPLFVIDGVEALTLPDNINLEMIENITVLKDAAAAAIWGARAGNGVIVITTKKGRGNLHIAYSNNFEIIAKPQLSALHRLQSADLIDFEKEAYAKHYMPDFSGTRYGYSPSGKIFQNRITHTISDAEMNRQLDSLAGISNTQQLQDYFLRNTFSQKHFLSFSGAANMVSYYLSGAYNATNNATLGSKNDMYNINSRLNFNLSRKLVLRTDMRVRFFNDRGGITPSTYALPYQMFTDANGNYLYDYSNFNEAEAMRLQKLGYYNFGKNELEEARLYNVHTKSFAFTSRFGLDWNIYKNIKWINDFQYDKAITDYKNLQSEKSYEVRTLLNRFVSTGTGNVLVFNLPKGDILNQQNDVRTAWIVKSAFTWDSFLDKKEKHYLNAIAGMEMRKYMSDMTRTRKLGYDDQMLTWKPFDQSKLAREGIMEWDGTISTYQATAYDYIDYNETREVSSFASAIYTYSRRYNLSASYRLDESNLFGASKKYRRNPIWSVGASWNVNNEAFFKSNVVHALLLRASYGITGNYDRTGRTTPLMVANRDYRAAVGGNVVTISSPPNPLLRWERVRSFNVGASVGLWNRLNIDAELYNNYSYDLLGNTVLDPTVGFETARINAADMSNKGVEVAITGSIINGNNFKWNAGWVFSYNKNKIINNKISDGNPELNRVTGTTQFVEGFPREAIWSYRWAGLDSTGAPQVYDDKNNKVKTLLLESVAYSGTELPVYTGSFSSEFQYKNISVNLLFTYNFGHKFRLPYPDSNPWNSGALYNDLTAQRWKKKGDELLTDIPAIQFLDANFSDRGFYMATYSSNSIRNAGFIRLAEVNVTYALPAAWLSKVRIKRASLSVQGNNVWLWTANKEKVDPLAISNLQYTMPVPPSVIFGLKVDM